MMAIRKLLVPVHYGHTGVAFDCHGVFVDWAELHYCIAIESKDKVGLRQYIQGVRVRHFVHALLHKPFWKERFDDLFLVPRFSGFVANHFSNILYIRFK